MLIEKCDSDFVKSIWFALRCDCCNYQTKYYDTIEEAINEINERK